MEKTNIVVSRYNKNCDFVDKIKRIDTNIKIFIYDKKNPENPLNIPVNEGNEASVYLKYIVDFYNELSEFTFFIHDEEFSWHHSGSIIDKYKESLLSLEKYYNINNKNVCGWWSPNSIQSNHYRELIEWYMTYVDPYIPLDKVPNNKDYVYGYLGCAQFLVHKELILNLPKKFYEDLYNWIINTKIGRWKAGLFLEWTWHVFWVIYPKIK